MLNIQKESVVDILYSVWTEEKASTGYKILVS